MRERACREEICLHIYSAYMSARSLAYIPEPCRKLAPLGTRIRQASPESAGKAARTEYTVKMSPGLRQNGLGDWAASAPSLPDKLRRTPRSSRLLGVSRGGAHLPFPLPVSPTFLRTGANLKKKKGSTLTPARPSTSVAVRERTRRGGRECGGRERPSRRA